MYLAHMGLCAWAFTSFQRMKLHTRLRKLFFRVYGRAKLPCAVCGLQLGVDDSTLDHILPVSRGGSYEPGNLTLSCVRCNQKRGNQPFHLFRFDRRAVLPADWDRLLVEKVLTLAG